MPLYSYECSNEECKDKFDTLQSFQDKPLKKCKKCNKNTLEKICAAISSFNPAAPKTLGSLINYNTSKKERGEL